MTADEILRGVAALFEQPGTWTQHAWARDAKGERLGRPLADEATCWCLMGAVRKVRGPAMCEAENEALSAICRITDESVVAFWNDAAGRTVEDVRRVAIQAAELLEGKR